MKVVINSCFGGFELSMVAKKRYCELIGKELYFYNQTKHKYINGIDEYIKIKNPLKNSIFSYSLFVDLGDRTNELPNEREHWFSVRDISRDDENLIRVIEELGENANSDFSDLKIVEIPDGIDFEIEEYDGQEWVSERHQTWS